MTRRARIAGYGSALALVIVGAGCAALISGTIGQVLAMALIGLGLVLAVSLVFAEVGFSEDRARAQAEKEGRGLRGRTQPRQGPQRRKRLQRPALHRRRGHRRNL